MSTFILKWNPAISSIRLDAAERMQRNFPFFDLNWSVWEHERVEVGDRFYMLRVGDGNTGITMHGMLSSEPELGEDWSGKGRETYYCDLLVSYLFDSETMPIITTEELEAAIPDFDWRRGHSGVALSAEQERKLDRLFFDYRKRHPELIADLDTRRQLMVQKSAVDSIRGHLFWYEMFDDLMGDDNAKFGETAVHDCANLSVDVDYRAGEVHLEVVFRMSDLLEITCSKIYQLTMKVNSAEEAMSHFRLYRVGDDVYMLESNGVKIVCGNITFDSLIPYLEKGVPSTI
jgi:hypothetical protein